MTDPEVTGMPVEEDDDLGIFPSWNALYWTVIAYTTVLIIVLYWLTVTLDHSP